jgi:ABC-type multidrug transport system fused ATPase/permease subunit
MGKTLIVHPEQTRLRVALDQLGLRQRWEPIEIMAGKILLAVLDLVLAILLYRFVLLLQANEQVLQIPILRVRLSFVQLALIVLSGFLVRMLGEVMVIRGMNRYRQKLYAHFLTTLTEDYMAVDWLTFVSYNRNDLVRYCLTTAQDAAYAYQLIAEQIAAAIVVGILVIGCFILGIVPATFWLTFLGCLLLFHQVMSRGRLQAASQAREDVLSKLQVGFAEMFESAKEIRIYENFVYFRGMLEGQVKDLGKNNALLSSLPQVSRCYIEYGAMIVFTVATAAAYLRKIDAQQLISMLVFYFILGRRILPTVSQLLMSMGQVDGAFDNIRILVRERAQARRERQAPGVSQPPSVGKILEMKNVRFSYNLGETIIDGMTFDIGPGEVVILKGASGEGKTTLLNLITGLLRHEAGEIYVNRSHLAYVPQDVVLLDDTVKANILFGLHDVSEVNLNAALDAAQLLDFVKGLPAGVDTRIGDNGALFSGGQRQRLGIARALLRRPRLLLLDEATSALDLESEERVLTRVRQVMVEGAIVLVTHRTHTVIQSARIIRVRKNMNDLNPSLPVEVCGSLPITLPAI